MKPCPWCEGRKVVGRIIRGEDAQEVDLGGGRKRKVVTLVDTPCRICAGTGEVTELQHDKLTSPLGIGYEKRFR